VFVWLITNRNWTNDTVKSTKKQIIAEWLRGDSSQNSATNIPKRPEIYLEGRLHYHSWTDNEEVQKTAMETVLDDTVYLVVCRRKQRRRQQTITQSDRERQHKPLLVRSRFCVGSG
jgi:single-stranded DNA-binding protein